MPMLAEETRKITRNRPDAAARTMRGDVGRHGEHAVRVGAVGRDPAFRDLLALVKSLPP